METARKQQIRLLKMIDSNPNNGVGASDDDPDALVLLRWSNSGIFDCSQSGQGKAGLIYFGPCLTDSGRALLDSLEDEEELSTSLGFIKRYRFKIYGWFFALIAGYILYLINKA